MRLRMLLFPLLALPVTLGGCGLLGSPAPAPGGTASATPIAGADWIVVATGSATPSPVSSPRGSRPPVLPPVSFLPVPSGCARQWTVSPLLIPLEVVPGAGKLTVTWPRQYDSDYRITAVRQPLVAGHQPNSPWQNVAAGTGCTVTATIGGLQPGVPYIVWLDAPGTGRERDGTRHPYSGRSGVVYPR